MSVRALCGCQECRDLAAKTAQEIKNTLGVTVITEFPSPEESIRNYDPKEVK